MPNIDLIAVIKFVIFAILLGAIVLFVFGQVGVLSSTSRTSILRMTVTPENGVGPTTFGTAQFIRWVLATMGSEVSTLLSAVAGAVVSVMLLGLAWGFVRRVF